MVAPAPASLVDLVAYLGPQRAAGSPMTLVPVERAAKEETAETAVAELAGPRLASRTLVRSLSKLLEPFKWRHRRRLAERTAPGSQRAAELEQAASSRTPSNFDDEHGEATP